MDYLASNSAELMHYVNNASAGDQILLEAGDYGSAYFGNRSFDTPVVIRSADPDNPVEFNGKIIVQHFEGLTFKGIDFVQGEQEGFGGNARFIIGESRNITVTDTTIAGRIPGIGEGTAFDNTKEENASLGPALEGYGFGHGLRIYGSENIEIASLDISKFAFGIGIATSKNVSIVDSHIHQMSSDGIDFESSVNLKI